MSGAILRRAVMLALAATACVTGRLAAQASEDECSMDVERISNLHLLPGTSDEVRARITVRTPAGMRTPRYAFRVMPSQLGSAAPARGEVQFNHSGTGSSGVNSGELSFNFTGQRRGAEAVVVRVFASEAVPESCQALEARAYISVGGTWRITADTTIEGDMSIRGSWIGVFDVVDDGQIDGSGTITTTVTGSCVTGWKDDPMKISGHVANDILHITIVGEPDDREPTTKIDPDMRCLVRTLRELPSFMQGIGTLIGMMTSNEPCPLRVPADYALIYGQCAGVRFQLLRTERP